MMRSLNNVASTHIKCANSDTKHTYLAVLEIALSKYIFTHYNLNLFRNIVDIPL